MLNTPVLFIIFNRPNTTIKVFEQIKKAQPAQLFIAGDGPRQGHKDDAALCAQTRKIVEQSDWPCEVKTLFHNKNLGCGVAPSSAIDWFFDHVEQGIILEDDCLPHHSFFFYCQALLDRYKNDSRIFHIGGTQYHTGATNSIKSDYYFIRIPRIGGWATWRRAWQTYDFSMSTFPQFKKEKIIQSIFTHEVVQNAWQAAFEKLYNELHPAHSTHVWDRQWAYAILSQNGLAITPTKNLISNIGFGEGATHTKDTSHFLSKQPTEEIAVETINHPEFIVPNQTDELWTMKHIFETPIPNGLLWETKKIIKWITSTRGKHL